MGRYRIMRPTPSLAILLVLPVLFMSSGIAQGLPVTSPSTDITLHSSSNLVLVNVIALNNQTGLPDMALQRGDFQILDNGNLVPITSFDTGTQARFLALWLVVQCKMPGWETQGSGLFAGHIDLFKAALDSLNKENDNSQPDQVAVAHWCDNGDSKIDLQPTRDIAHAATALEQVLAAAPSPPDHSRTGELALQHTMQLIIEATRSSVPQPLPVIIFLYGDYSAMPRAEADRFIDELLQTSAVAFGLKDRRSPNIWWLPGEQRAIAHYIATQTGGQYLEVTPETYTAGLTEILRQLHGRYELGFKPETLDGKRHALRVTLTETAKHQHKGLRLRYRLAYVPAAR